ncbi:PKD domain-containing protein [Crocinitomix algicola]|uniref:PKD domain-containing protein n=1 Tax=Crocinitomix algicola TaxID=1740263 RepID=UPI000873328E|nr:PKD domain-containing protein [Crocinitomix algicola]
MKNRLSKIALLSATFTLLFAGCKKEPTASFAYSATDDGVAHFTNTSENGVSYEWDFGDGTKSKTESPTHSYEAPGTYFVSMTAYSKKEKKSDKVSQNIVIPGPAINIWNGPTMTFTKADGADWTLAANQDRITNNVWITRANNRGLFNIADEVDYSDFVSPTKTEWAYGSLFDAEDLTYNSWENLHGSSPNSMIGKDVVLHLTEDDIYLSFKLTSWASGGAGGMGGFSYERSTQP